MPATLSTLARVRIHLQQWALARLGGLPRSIGLPHRAPRPAHLLIGERGELEALFYLRRLGYVIVARRWRSPQLRGDLDLVAWEGDTLCFIEVKTRSARDRTPAALAVDQRKRRMLARMARAYLRTLPRSKSATPAPKPLTRLDIVSVYLLPQATECELIRDAFDWRQASTPRFGV